MKVLKPVYNICLTFEVAAYPAEQKYPTGTHKIGVRVPIMAESEKEAVEILRKRMAELLGDK